MSQENTLEQQNQEQLVNLSLNLEGKQSNIRNNFKVIDQQGILVYKFAKADFQIKYIQNVDLKTTRDIAEQNQLIAIINAGFFLQNLSHAGLLRLDRNDIVKLAPQDKQLNGVVQILANDIIIVPIEKLDTNNLASIAFQTGPVFITDSQIQQSYIQNSLNGLGKYIRSFLGYDKDYYYIGYTSVPASLTEISELLIVSLGNQNPYLNFINLDGGSSTSFYLSSENNNSFRSSKQLPFLIGISAN